MKLLVVPLLSVAFLTSCWGDEPDPEPGTDIHVVTEEEFNDAIAMKDIHYAKCELEARPDVYDHDKTDYVYIASPTASYVSYQNLGEDLNESYFNKKGESTVIQYTKGLEDKWYIYYSDSDHIIDIQNDYYFNLTYDFQPFNLNFDLLNYNSDSSLYSAEYEIKMEGPMSQNIHFKTTMKFENKKIVSCDMSAFLANQPDKVIVDTTRKFSYEEITPEFPFDDNHLDNDFFVDTKESGKYIWNNYYFNFPFGSRTITFTFPVVKEDNPEYLDFFNLYSYNGETKVACNLNSNIYKTEVYYGTADMTFIELNPNVYYQFYESGIKIDNKFYTDFTNASYLKISIQLNTPSFDLGFGSADFTYTTAD